MHLFCLPCESSVILLKGVITPFHLAPIRHLTALQRIFAFLHLFKGCYNTFKFISHIHVGKLYCIRDFATNSPPFMTLKAYRIQ